MLEKSMSYIFFDDFASQVFSSFLVPVFQARLVFENTSTKRPNRERMVADNNI